MFSHHSKYQLLSAQPATSLIPLGVCLGSAQPLGTSEAILRGLEPRSVWQEGGQEGGQRTSCSMVGLVKGRTFSSASYLVCVLVCLCVC